MWSQRVQKLVKFEWDDYVLMCYSYCALLCNKIIILLLLLLTNMVLLVQYYVGAINFVCLASSVLYLFSVVMIHCYYQ